MLTKYDYFKGYNILQHTENLTKANINRLQAAFKLDVF